MLSWGTMLLALLLALVHPTLTTAVAQAPPAPTLQVYRTYIRPRFESFGYAGELRITITNGYVNGTYRPDTGGTLVPVHGGSQGSDIWFDIATLGRVHIQGTIKGDGTITGYGLPSGPSGKQYVFTAKPEASPAP
ncbi:MAG: hypothetical protein WBG27_06435 [Candidatus Aquilonibacter sp.]